jgi:hypothetical protein
MLRNVLMTKLNDDGSAETVNCKVFEIGPAEILVFAGLEFPETGEIIHKDGGRVWMTAEEAAVLPDLYKMTREAAAQCVLLVGNVIAAKMREPEPCHA